MRIGVVSDSHGRLDLLRNAVNHMKNVDLLLHAGDYYKDAMAIKDELSVPLYAVIGNCDQSVQWPEEEVIEIEGRKILLTHGHQYGVKSGSEELVQRIKKEGFDLIVFGHTHIAAVIPVGRSLIFNPGSVTKPRRGTARTYGIIEFKEQGITPYIKEVSG